MPSNHLEKLVGALRNPSVYPHATDSVETVQTHISVVFLAGTYAYKLKKPVDLGFLDYTTLEKRLECCRQEVRLNRRLAPWVYCGVAPILERKCGFGIGPEMKEYGQSEVDGEIVEYAVKMIRLPEDRTFRALLQRGVLTRDLLERLARKLVAFYSRADRGEEVSRIGDWPVLAENCEENFEQVEPFVGQAVSQAVFDRLRAYTGAALEKFRSLIERRAREQVPRDSHGDLRLEHVYAWAREGGMPEILAVDCIEFNKRFRYADPVLDIAFLAMELEFEGCPELSRVFTEAYVSRTKDREARDLLPLYIAYRHMVRGKVCGLKARQEEVSPEKREEAEARARAHFLGACGRLASPNERPCLVLIGGLPGVGKTTVARRLEEDLGFVRISSDIVRKELAGLPGTAHAKAAFEEGIYSPAWTHRTYAEVRRRALKKVFQGKRVLVDASFGRERDRECLLDAGNALGVPCLLLLFEADRDLVRQRIESRTPGPSDADWKVYREAARRWEPIGAETQRATRRVSAEGDPASTLVRAVECLAGEGLACPPHRQHIAAEQPL